MTKNFKILKQFNFSKNQGKIIEKIEEMEDNLKSKKWSHKYYLDGRNILELLIPDFIEKLLNNKYDESSNLNLSILIDHLNRHHTIPYKVYDELHSIKKLGNEDAHATRLLDEPYIFPKDNFAVVEFLKKIFIVIKFFIKEINKNNWTSEDDKEYEFDSSIYLPNYDENSMMNKFNEYNNISPDAYNVQAKLKGLFELISSNYNFLIPIYQRDYDWTNQNVETFLEDIKERSLDGQKHFMGSLALATEESNKILRVIDGQQRITTSLLLIKAMINKFKSLKTLKMPQPLFDLSGKLEQKYINKPDQGELSFVQKILRGINNGDYEFLNSNSFKNYKFIQEYLDNLDENDFNEFCRAYVFKFLVVETKFQHEYSKEIQIFENLNSKGKELEEWDIIKNYIFKNIELTFLIDQENEIEAILKKFFISPANRFFGKNRVKKLSDFFRIYSRIISKLNHGKVLSDSEKTNKLFAKLWPENTKNKFNSHDSLNQSLISIAKCFNVYCRLNSQADLSDIGSPLFDLKLHIKNTSSKDVHYGLMINAIMQSSEWDGNILKKIKKNNLPKLKELLSDIDKYITRLMVVRPKGQSLSIFLDEAIEKDISKSHDIFLDIISEPGLDTSIPSYEEFKNVLNEKNDWHSHYALAVLRTFQDDVHSINSKKYNIIKAESLEHIFPQNPNSNSTWFTEANLSPIEFKDKYKTKINKLGNFLVLSKPLNAKASNNSFIHKLKEYKKMSNSELIFGKNNNHLMDLTIKNSFTFDDIDERSNQLSKLIAPLYKLSNNK